MADSPPDIVVPTPYGTLNYPHDTPPDEVRSRVNEWIKQREPGSEKVGRVMEEAPFFPGASLYGSMTPSMRGEFNLAETDVIEWLRQQAHRIPGIGSLFPDQGKLEQEREKQRQLAASGTPVERATGRVAGTVFNPVYGGIGETAEMLGGVTRTGRVLAGAGAGGAGAAVQPGPPGETGKQEVERTTRETGEGGALGGVLSALLMGHGSEAADILAAGIRPTLSDLIPAGVGQDFEHMAARVPILRKFITGAGGRQVEDYNRYLYRYAVEPTEGRVRAPADVGTDALRRMRTDIGNEMNQARSNLSITGSAVAPILSRFRASVFYNVPGGATFSQANRAYIDRAIRDAVERPIILSGGRATGRTLLQIDSELSKLAEAKQRSAISADDYNTARALRMLQDEITNNLQGPQESIDRLRQSRTAYARYKEVAEAAGRGPRGELATPDTYRGSMMRRQGRPDRYAELDDPRKTVTESASTLGVGKRMPQASAIETGLGLRFIPGAAYAGGTAPLYTAPGMWALAHQPQLMSPLAALATQAQGGDRQ